MNNIDKIQNKLVGILKEKTPSQMNPVEVLMGILPMSKEAAYRRLRGEIDFTLEEAVKLAQKLDISIDKLIKGRYLSTIPDVIRIFDPIKEDDFYENHCLSMEIMIDNLKKIKKGNNPAVVSTATAIFAHPCVYKYESLTKFRALKYLYSKEDDFKDMKFSEFVIPDKIDRLERMLYNEIVTVSITYIVTNEFLNEYKSHVQYFYKLGILSKDDVDLIKRDHIAFFSELNEELSKGKNKHGYPLIVYVSNLEFEKNCVYFSNEEYEVAVVNLFGSSLYSFSDEHSLDDVKKWFNNLKKSSILISLCAEAQRTEFINKQLKILSSFDELSQLLN